MPRVEVVHGGGASHAMMVHDPKSAEKLVGGVRDRDVCPTKHTHAHPCQAPSPHNLHDFMRRHDNHPPSYSLRSFAPDLQLYSANATVCSPEDGVLPAGVHRFRFGFTLPVEFIPSVDLKSYAESRSYRDGVASLIFLCLRI